MLVVGGRSSLVGRLIHRWGRSVGSNRCSGDDAVLGGTRGRSVV